MTASIAATGILSTSMLALAKLIASSETFRAEVGSIDAAAALAHIPFPEAKDFDDGTPGGIDTRPRAIVSQAVDFDRGKTGNGLWQGEGSLLLSFEFLPMPAVDYWPANYWPQNFWPADYWAHNPAKGLADELLRFKNTVGAILREMEINAGLDTYLNMIRYRLVQGPFRCDPSEENGAYFYGITLHVTWKG